MSWDVWVPLLGAFVALSVLLLVTWAPRFRDRAPRPEQLPPPNERPDYRHLAQVERICPECAQPYVTLSGFRAEKSCDACVKRRFEASEQNDREFWRGKGWEDAS